MKTKILSDLLDRIFGKIVNVDRWYVYDEYIFPFKGTTTTDVAAFYCPYVPLITTNSNSTIGILGNSITVFEDEKN